MMRYAVYGAMFAMLPVVAHAQGEITGRVFASDSGRPPIRGVQVSVARLRLDATSDSSGRFRFTDVPPGDYLVVLRAVGFTPESSTVSIDRDEVVSLEKVLTRTTTLPNAEWKRPRTGHRRISSSSTSVGRRVPATS